MDDRAIKRLFTRLGAEFGHKFYSLFPTDEAEQAARAIWAERLAGLSMDEIRAGVDKLSDYAARHDGWPPGAAEFRELCRPHREPYHRLVDMEPYRQLEQQRASKDFAMKQIAKMRNRMGEGES